MYYNDDRIFALIIQLSSELHMFWFRVILIIRLRKEINLLISIQQQTSVQNAPLSSDNDHQHIILTQIHTFNLSFQ